MFHTPAVIAIINISVLLYSISRNEIKAWNMHLKRFLKIINKKCVFSVIQSSTIRILLVWTSYYEYFLDHMILFFSPDFHIKLCNLITLSPLPYFETFYGFFRIYNLFYAFYVGKRGKECLLKYPLTMMNVRRAQSHIFLTHNINIFEFG